MHTNPSRPLAVAAAACGLALTLAACGDGRPTSDHPTSGRTGSAEAQAEADPGVGAHGPADVAFATAMIQHHAQALSMVEMTRGRRLSPDVRRLAAAIRAAQAPEIATMSSWLRGWHRPVPDAHASQMSATAGSMGAEVPGMMSDADMARLMKAPDAAFERLWLQTMVEHHAGAIRMAGREQTVGRYRPAVALAGRIITAQRAEITRMRSMLAR